MTKHPQITTFEYEYRANKHFPSHANTHTSSNTHSHTHSHNHGPHSIPQRPQYPTSKHTYRPRKHSPSHTSITPHQSFTHVHTYVCTYIPLLDHSGAAPRLVLLLLFVCQTFTSPLISQSSLHLASNNNALIRTHVHRHGIYLHVYSLYIT